MVLHNLWSVSLSIECHCITKRSALWPVGLTHSSDFGQRDMVDSNPFKNQNLLTCLWLWILLGLVFCHFFRARILLQILVEFTDILYELLIIRFSYISCTIYTDFVTRVLFEPFIWYRSLCDCILKKKKEGRNISSISTQKKRSSGRCLEQGRFTYGRDNFRSFRGYRGMKGCTDPSA